MCIYMCVCVGVFVRVRVCAALESIGPSPQCRVTPLLLLLRVHVVVCGAADTSYGRSGI